MGRAEAYDALVFELGDLARERLAQRPHPPKTMDRVFRAEEDLLQKQEELVALEDQLNQTDARYRAFVEAQEQERLECQAIVKENKRAVDGVASQVKDARRKLQHLRGDARALKGALRMAEKRQASLELPGVAQIKRDEGQVQLKRARVSAMRADREAVELEQALAGMLSPEPGSAGEEAILAYRRLIEMDDEAEAQKAELAAAAAELEADIAACVEANRASEEFLDQALYLLGGECYALRVPDPALAPLYLKLDKAK
ncbi:MAG: hypothetical protein ACKVPX_04680 [Myxococcaceae bacterium]